MKVTLTKQEVNKIILDYMNDKFPNKKFEGEVKSSYGNVEAEYEVTEIEKKESSNGS